MDVERFETLALAYGGDLRRWPESDRDAAEAFRLRSPEAARAVLGAAGDLDVVLHAWSPPVVPAGLRERVLASAPAPKARPAAAPRGFRYWLSGAGFAAVAVAGVIVGVIASSAAVSNERADAVLSATLSNEGDTAQAPFTIGSGEARAA